MSRAATLDGWWREFAATGRVPATLQTVHSRLIRSVHRGDLDGEPVFVKVMTFPRLRDRLRYLVRALPARHEAAMLRRIAAAGIPCPEVVDVRVARRFGVPLRSWLVTRALPVVEDAPPLSGQAELAVALLAAGVVHRDLHADNFVSLADGRLAVLDLQSALARPAPATDSESRLAVAARLVRDLPESAAAALCGTALIANDTELAEVVRRAAALRAAYRRRRILRCLTESTEFTRRVRWHGVEHRHRSPRPLGRWIRGGSELRDCWIGERALGLLGARSPVFWAFFRKWWWLGGACALYVPQACREERIESELAAARRGVALLDGRTQLNGPEEDGEGRPQPESAGRGSG